jgi:hypothetical protein
MKTLTIILAAVVLSLLAAGCGSTGSAASGEETNARDEDAPLEWARCMREHGVDVPDPQVDDEGRFRIQVGGRGVRPDDAKVRRAMRACGSLLGKMRNGEKEPSAEDRARFEEQALKFARCMRAHGVDIPDPKFDGGGGILMEKPAPGTKDSAKFREASEACRDLLPGPPGEEEEDE